MTTAVFNLMFDKLIGAEGGFQNDPKDRGNWTSGIIGKGECKGTKYGVSAMENESPEHPRGEKWNKETTLQAFREQGYSTSSARLNFFLLT